MKSKAVESKVRKILSQNEECRNSDKRLALEYWETHDGLRLSPEQKATFMRATPFESISRSRRHLRAEYPGNEAVEEARYNLFIESRNEFGEPIMIFKEAK